MKLAPLVPLLLLVAADKDPYAKLASLTFDQFARKMEKRDDDLTTSITYSTKAGHRKAHSNGGLLGTQSDMWLQASVDKRTGAKTYSVIAAATWVGRAHYFRSATYAMPDGPQDAVVTLIDNRLSGCIALGCDYTTIVALDIDRATLAKASEAGVPWRFRFRSTTGAVFENAIASVEIRAILEAVDVAR